MASDRATLNVSERAEFGSRTSRRLRRSGFVPGIVYGGGNEPRPFQVPERDARAVLTHGGALIDVRFDGSSPTPVVVKEQQRDPVRGQLIHLDLLEVKLDQEIQAEVPIELLGTEEAPGVKEGGVLEHVTHQNAALVQETTATTLAFEGEAQRLTAAVGRFKFSRHARPA